MSYRSKMRKQQKAAHQRRVKLEREAEAMLRRTNPKRKLRLEEGEALRLFRQIPSEADLAHAIGVHWEKPEKEVKEKKPPKLWWTDKNKQFQRYLGW